MPITIYHQPAALIGQLAANAGNFATGQVVNQDNLGWSHLGLQQQAQAQQAQMEQDRLQQQQQLQQAGFQHEDMQNAVRQQFQQDITDREFQHRQALMERQYGLQGQNQQQLADVNNQYRQGTADQRDATARYGIDQRSGLGYDRLDQQQQQSEARLEAQKQHWNDLVTNGDRSGSLALRQQQEQRIASNQQLQQQDRYHRFRIQDLEKQMGMLDRQLSGPQSLTMDPEAQRTLQTKRQQLNDQYARETQQYRNFMLGLLAPDPNAGYGGAANVPGVTAGDSMESYPVRAPEIVSGQYTPQQPPYTGAYGPPGPGQDWEINLQQQQQQPFSYSDDEEAQMGAAQQATGFPPYVSQAVSEWKGQGYTREQIIAALAQNFGITE